MISVVCAVLWRDARVLLAQRPESKAHGGLWELPGGKIEGGESAETALIREVREELGISIGVGDFLAATEWSGSGAAGGPFKIHLQAFHCHSNDWTGLTLHEHQALFWYDPREPLELPLAPADEPLIAALRQQVSSRDLARPDEKGWRS